MNKRLISANPSDIKNMTSQEIKQSIKASEGRVVLTEVIAQKDTYIGDITGAEVACAFGSDMILLNGVDVFKPVIKGLTKEEEKDFVRSLKKYTGKLIGVNLEPVDTTAAMLETRGKIAMGRQASVETFQKANELGLDFICLTGNPGVGVTNKAIISSIKTAKEHFDGLIIAGKMHGAGVNEPVLTEAVAEAIISAGADVLLVPSIGSVPGVRPNDLYKVVDYAHSKEALVMSTIGTSQESSDSDTIKRMAIDNKIAGVDIQHIGDAGYHGMSLPENIYALSVAIRGRRHTISRIARSINR
ncbi:DUF7916 family protein [Facklamia miroungae]|uniref:DUF7916 domain-containing protein n=1 Tax=Facklamia miroungae TaxID=120956 RepID=A0A1G7TD87_9LACT|nr:PEP phosphonomutase [Facklamia miroungae]NKZ29766.1 WecB/TagA/CpsF family glycosyltransferase [Facklamia miroungae]SDG32994.1 hypothetical protein SAMN05421791_10595 [Facklamia miroungae]